MEPFGQSPELPDTSLASDRTSTWLEGVSLSYPVPSDGGIDDTSVVASDETYSAVQDVSVSDRSASTVTGTNTARVYIRMVNGSRILIPIAASATVADLHVEAVRRSTRFGVPCTTDSTILQTIGQNAATIFGEDYLADVLAATENDTFLLDTVNAFLDPSSSVAGGYQGPTTAPSIATPTTPSISTSLSTTPTNQKRSSEIYVRWITPKAAMDNSCLKDIEVDPVPVPSDMLLSDFRKTAFGRLYPRPTGQVNPLSEGTTVDLYLSYCYLSDIGQNTVTLGDMELEGNQKHPLNVFVVLTRKLDGSELKKPQNMCGYDCTDRGAATFVTSLKTMISEIEKKRASLENLLEVLWEITHFPPALISFRLFYERGYLAAREGPYSALPVLAECFREISLRIVPRYITDHPDRVLEASRQIFGWLYSLRSEASLSSDGNQTLVHAVELMDVSTSESSGITGMFDNQVLIEVPVRGSSEDPSKKKLLVSLQNLDHVPPRALTLALNGLEGSRCNYYFHLPPKSRGLLGHKRSATLHSGDFDNLLKTTNQIHAFKMVGPLQLVECTSASLPIITLDGDGFVSTYGQQDIACGEREFYTWNSIKGHKSMPETNPGQYLLQKLEPIIAERKKHKTWEIDAWTKSDMDHDMTNPEEAIVICVDLSGSMGWEMGKDWMENQEMGTVKTLLGKDKLTRLNEAQETFRNLVSRISAYSLPTHMGLVTFSSRFKVEISQPLSPVLLNFQHRLDNASPDRGTAIWDGIDKAKGMLKSFKAKHPGAKCRIIALTDGEDTNSSLTPSKVCSDLYDNDIVLDTVIIGTEKTRDLFKIAKHTGGYAFCPKSRIDLFQIFLLETFIDISTRPDIVKIPVTNWYTSVPKAPDMKDRFDFPKCRPHPNHNDNFLSLRDANRFCTNLSKQPTPISSSAATVSSSSSISRQSTMSGTTVGGTTGSASGSSRYFLTEVKAMIENQHEYMDIYISESNMGFWKVVMQGPPASPYQNGTFLLYIEIGDSFPRKAPSARFITPILHPNITKHGRICHPIFDREWTPTIRVHDVLSQIWGILMSLEPRDAVDPLFTLKFWTDYESGRREVEQYVQHFASRSRAAHRADILGIEPATPTSLASYYSTQRRPVPVSGLSPVNHTTTSLRPTIDGMANSPPASSAWSTTSASIDSTTQDKVLRRPSETGPAAGPVASSNADTNSVGSGSSSRRRRSSIFGSFSARFGSQRSSIQQNPTQSAATQPSFVVKGFRPADERQ